MINMENNLQQQLEEIKEIIQCNEPSVELVSLERLRTEFDCEIYEIHKKLNRLIELLEEQELRLNTLQVSVINNIINHIDKNLSNKREFISDDKVDLKLSLMSQSVGEKEELVNATQIEELEYELHNDVEMYRSLLSHLGVRSLADIPKSKYRQAINEIRRIKYLKSNGYN